MLYQFNNIPNNTTNMVPSNITIPEIYKVRGYPWISYGSDNLYPSYVTELFNKSAINKRALLSKILGVFGGGLRTVDTNLESVLDVANPEESWNDVFEKLVTDYEIYGGFAVNVIWNKTGTKIHSFYHLAFENIRSGEMDAMGKVDEYFYCSSWKNFKKWTPIKYAAFNPEKSIECPSQVLYFFDYTPGNLYYPLPSYSGSLQDITIDVEVSNLHLSNLQNGLNPSLFVSFHNGMPDPAHQQEVYNALASSFATTANTGKFFLAFSDDKEHAPEVTPIESANDEYYVNLETRITTRILSGHGITSPLLMGLYHEGGSGLGSNKDEILVSYEHFKTTVLQPDIKALLKPMNKLVKYFGYETELYIEPLKMFDAGTNTIQSVE